MQFFNQQEEVIDIQLTQFGKRLLSEGGFKPAYYAFYDNDILYDLNYANASGSYKETQSQTEKRITKETPRLKTQYMFESSMRATGKQWVEEDWTPIFLAGSTDVAGALAFVQSTLAGEDPSLYQSEISGNPYGYIQTGGKLQLTFERNYSLGLPIGTMKMGSEHAPAWEIDFLYGKMNNYETHHTGSGAPIKIPQLNAEINFESFTLKIDPDTGVPARNYIPDKLTDINAELLFDAETPYPVAKDGTSLQIKPDYLLLEMYENNTDFLKDNFELEVFQITETNTDSQTGNTIIEEMPLEFHTIGPLGPQHVEYWFDVSYDETIESMFFCASDIVADRKRSRLTDSFMAYPDDCPEYTTGKNLYKEVVYEQEEPC